MFWLACKDLSYFSLSLVSAKDNANFFESALEVYSNLDTISFGLVSVRQVEQARLFLKKCPSLSSLRIQNFCFSLQELTSVLEDRFLPHLRSLRLGDLMAPLAALMSISLLDCALWPNSKSVPSKEESMVRFNSHAEALVSHWHPCCSTLARSAT